MFRKPTYEELEQKVRALKKEVVELRCTEKSRREIEEHIIQRSSVPTFVIDNGHHVTHWNKACENLTGISANEIIGTRNQWRAFYSAKRPTMADLIVENASGEDIAACYGDKYCDSEVIDEAYEAEDFFSAIGEKGRWLFFTAAPLKNGMGKISGAIETIQDVSDRRKAKEALREIAHGLGERVKELNCLFGISNLIEQRGISLDVIFQGTVDLIPAAMQYPEIGYARIFLEGKEFKTSKYEETKWRQVADIIVHGEPIGRLAVGYLEEKPEWGEVPFLREERRLLNAIAERVGKIVERKRAEAALFETEKRFRDLVENSITGISIIQNDQIVYQNPVQEKLLGPLPRKPKLTEIGSIFPDDIEKIEAFYKNISPEMVRTKETDFRFYSPEKRGNNLDLKWVQCQASAIEYQGKAAILINMMDITRLKELESFLRIQDKMSSLGRVAAGIAHEIRNPLSGINIYLDTLGKLYDKEESLGKVRQILGQLQSASNKIESVIRRVMDFSKPSTPKFVMTGINQPLEDAIGLASVSLRKRSIKIEKDLAKDLPMVYADPQLIEQVILNLITNAVEAMKNVSGVKQIKVTSLAESNRILLKISDSGPGVPSNLREKIFDPFFTSKTESTGIGLSLCHRIMTDHGGSLSVSESRWGGAEFTIEILIK